MDRSDADGEQPGVMNCKGMDCEHLKSEMQSGWSVLNECSAASAEWCIFGGTVS